jgi:hypothetical protein
MPRVDSSELERMVADGKVGAITLDTSIFDRFSCDLDSPSLTAVQQFVGSPVSYILSDLVLGEVRSHMIRDAELATSAVRSALKGLARFRRPDRVVLNATPGRLGLDRDIEEEVDTRITDYVAHMGASKLNAGGFLDPDVLVQDYQATLAPFETGKGKKSEFPDAIALLELETWGEQSGKHVLAVAADRGWMDFAKRARWVLVVEDLATALGLFNRVDRHVLERAAGWLAEPDRFPPAEELQQTLSRYIDEMNVDIQAHSAFFYGADFCGAELRRWVPPEAEDMTMIASDEKSLTLSFPVTVEVTAEATFTLSIRDSTDGDYISVGGASVVRDIHLDVPIVLRVARESGPEDAVIDIKAESGRYVTLDFGNVEPDFDDEG